MDTVNHPHDALFKETLGDLDVTTDFLEHYLPEEMLAILDTDSLTPLKDSHVQTELRDTYSDLLFQTTMEGQAGYLYFLFEHKSSPKTDIAFQLLGYMSQIWNNHITKEKAKSVPIIIPIVFYHGERKWKNPKKISDWIVGYEQFPAFIKNHVPDFDLLYYDFSIHGNVEVKGNPKLRAYLELSKYIFTRDMALLLETIIKIEELLSAYEPAYFDTIMIYLLNTRSDMPVGDLKEQLTIEGRKRLMTIAEQLREEGRREGRSVAEELREEGMKEGRQVGIKEGRLEGIKEGQMEGELQKSRDIAKNLLLLNMDKNQIIMATGLSQVEIESIEEEI